MSKADASACRSRIPQWWLIALFVLCAYVGVVIASFLNLAVACPAGVEVCLAHLRDLGPLVRCYASSHGELPKSLEDLQSEYGLPSPQLRCPFHRNWGYQVIRDRHGAWTIQCQRHLMRRTQWQYAFLRTTHTYYRVAPTLLPNGEVVIRQSERPVGRIIRPIWDTSYPTEDDMEAIARKASHRD